MIYYSLGVTGKIILAGKRALTLQSQYLRDNIWFQWRNCNTTVVGRHREPHIAKYNCNSSTYAEISCENFSIRAVLQSGSRISTSLGTTGNHALWDMTGTTKWISLDRIDEIVNTAKAVLQGQTFGATRKIPLTGNIFIRLRNGNANAFGCHWKLILFSTIGTLRQNNNLISFQNTKLIGRHWVSGLGLWNVKCAWDSSWK